MAVEAKRGCGYRKTGGLYLVGIGLASPCDRLPYLLEVCPVCSQGVKQTMGFTWLDWEKFAGEHLIPNPNFAAASTNPEASQTFRECDCQKPCPICVPGKEYERYGLLWVGRQFYRTPEDFIKEARVMGVSKRIGAIPKGLEFGKTYILLAHPVAGEKEVDDPKSLTGKKKVKVPGIFYGFVPQRVEKIITETQSKNEEEMEKLRKRGITPVVVPDNDKDHQGTVYDKEEKEDDGKAAA